MWSPRVIIERLKCKNGRKAVVSWLDEAVCIWQVPVYFFLHFFPHSSLFSPPITQSTRMPLAACEPKDVWSLHFKATWIIFASSVSWGKPLKKTYSQRSWWLLLVCVCFVCWSKPISLQKCLPSRWWVSGLNSKKEQPGALTVQAKQTFYELFDQQQVYSDLLTADSFWLVNSRYNLISQQQVHFDWLTAGQYYLVNIMFILIHQEQVHSDWSTAG